MLKILTPVAVLAAAVLMAVPLSRANAQTATDQAAAASSELTAQKKKTTSSPVVKHSTPHVNTSHVNVQRNVTRQQHTVKQNTVRQSHKVSTPTVKNTHRRVTTKSSVAVGSSGQGVIKRGSTKTTSKVTTANKVTPKNLKTTTKTTIKPIKSTTKVTDRKLKTGPGLVSKKNLKTGPGVRDRRLVNKEPQRWRNWKRPPRIVVVRGPRRFWWGNGWRTFVPYAALGAFVVGAETFYPDGYVSMPAPVCSGITADGCRLRWQDVPTEEGGSEPQCVQYCATQNRSVAEVALPEEPAVEAPAMAPATPAPATSGVAPAEGGERTGCELTIYSEPDLKGEAAPSLDDQATLDQDGWKNQIASLEIKSGTWDFFADDNYSGDAMRLKAGTYRKLDPKWTKKIGSFMCSEPAK